MILWLSVRLGDAVTQGAASLPITVDGAIMRFSVHFEGLKKSDSARGDREFLESIREVLQRGRVKLYVNSLLMLEAEHIYDVPPPQVYEIPTLAPDAPRELPKFPAPWMIHRGDTLRFEVALTGDAPKAPIVLRAV
ncbi:MAG: hypothetical protein ACRD1X_22085, partial [Vicinamibacteria bacterium]